MSRSPRRFAVLATFFLLLLMRLVATEMTQPVALQRAAPNYPLEMRRERIGGSVVVEFIVNTDGAVRNARVVRSSRKEFEAPALQAIATWRFKPGTKNGRPVNVLASQTMEFNSPRAWAQPFGLLQKKGTDTVTLAYWQNEKGQLARFEVVQAGSPESGKAAAAILADDLASDPTLNEAAGTEQRTTYNFGVEELSASAREILGRLDKPEPGFARPNELDKPIVARVRADPVFPLALQETETKGEATIEFFIDRKGMAQLPHVVSASREEFGFAAAQAVAQWKFTVPTSKGKPVCVRVKAPIEFQLVNKPPAPPVNGVVPPAQ